MLLETILLGVNHFFAPGSLIVSLTLIAVLLFFGKDVKTYQQIGYWYVLGIALTYFFIFEGRFAQLRFELSTTNYASLVYSLCGFIFVVLGMVFVKEWIGLMRSENRNPIISFRLAPAVKKPIKQTVLISLVSFVVAAIVAFFATETLDSQKVFDLMVEALAKGGKMPYLLLIAAYVIALLVPVNFGYCLLFLVFNSKKQVTHKRKRLILAIFSALYLGVGISILYTIK